MVQIENLSRILDEHPFCHGIGQDLRDLLVGCAANERFDAGDYIFKEGQRADKFYLIRSGQVSIEVNVSGGSPITVETVHDGDVLGWSWLVEPYQWHFDARAVGLTRGLSLDANCLRRKMEQDPALGFQVLRRFMPVMGRRLSAARLQMLDLYGPRGGRGGRKP